MKKKFFKSTIMVTALVASCFGSLKTYQTYNHVSNSLLLENVEALSNYGECPTGYAKEYETGQGLYITSISGRINTNVNIGMRLGNGFEAQVEGSIKAELLDEWKMTCLERMGCYTSCVGEDWHAGHKTDKIVTGCQN